MLYLYLHLLTVTSDASVCQGDTYVSQCDLLLEIENAYKNSTYASCSHLSCGEAIFCSPCTCKADFGSDVCFVRLKKGGGVDIKCPSHPHAFQYLLRHTSVHSCLNSSYNTALHSAQSLGVSQVQCDYAAPVSAKLLIAVSPYRCGVRSCNVPIEVVGPLCLYPHFYSVALVNHSHSIMVVRTDTQQVIKDPATRREYLFEAGTHAVHTQTLDFPLETSLPFCPLVASAWHMRNPLVDYSCADRQTATATKTSLIAELAKCSLRLD